MARAMNLEFFPCDLNAFIRHYLPKCDQKSLKQVRDRLIAEGHMTAHPDEPNVFSFTKFNEKPSERKRKYDIEIQAAMQAGLPLPEFVDEETIFNPLQDITDFIIVCLGNLQQRARLSLQMWPDATLEVDMDGGNQ